MGERARWLLVCVFVVVLSACQFSAPFDAIFSAQPVIPRGGTVTLAFSDGLDVVQPWHVQSRAAEAFVTVTQAGLMRLDNVGVPQLELLAGWTAAPDGTVITATLKPDLVWSDEQPLTSADVAYTYAALLTFAPTTPVLRELSVLTAVRAVDSLTVVFTLQRPYAPLLSLWALPILPMHVLGTQPIESLNLITLSTGAGPFIFSEKDSAGSLHLNANPQYHRGEPFLDGLVIVPELNQKGAIDGLRTGQIGIAELMEYSGDVSLNSVSTASIEQNSLVALVFNLRNEYVTADPELRSIVQSAIPVSETMQLAGLTQFAAQESLALSAHPFAATVTVTKTIDIQPLFARAGWQWDEDTRQFFKDEKPLTLRLGIDSTNQSHVRIAEALVALWRLRGLSVELIPMRRSQYLEQFIPPFAFDMAIVEWGNGRSDSQYADTYIYDGSTYPLFARDNVNTGLPDVRPTLNLSGYTDSSYESLQISAQSLYEYQKRTSIERDALIRVLQSNAVIPLARRMHTMVWQSSIATPKGEINLDTPWYLWGVEQWYLAVE